jgi:hypothetical protein
MEGQPHCLWYCLSCTPTLPVADPVSNEDTPNYTCLDRGCSCVMHTMLQEPDAYCLPCDNLSDMATLDPPPSYSKSHNTRDQLRILWHQCLGHLHNRHMKLLSKTTISVPDLATDDELHKCPVCRSVWLPSYTRPTRGQRTLVVLPYATKVSRSMLVSLCNPPKNPSRCKKNTRLNGETCYFTIANHKSRTIYRETCASKAPPIEFVN